MLSLLRSLLLSGLAACLLAPAAWAASPVTVGLNTTSSVVNSCIVNSADTLSFGTYSPIASAPATASSSVVLTCTKKATFSITPTSSSGFKMTGAGGALAYSLFQDAAFSQSFGAGATPNFSATYASNQQAAFGSAITLAQYNANIASYKSLSVVAVYQGMVYLNFLGIVNDGSAFPNGKQVGFHPSWTTVTSGGALTAQSDPYFVVPQGSTPITGKATSALTKVTLPFYGRAAAGQDIVPGAYADTVVLTVTF
jgi:spore coat protein U-like protein